MFSDEDAARAAEKSGDRHQVLTAAKIWGMEPASFREKGEGPAGRLCEVPSLYFTSRAPICDTCAEQIEWLGPGQATASGFIYRVRCGCGEDEITYPGRLVMAETVAWWAEQGWNMHGCK